MVLWLLGLFTCVCWLFGLFVWFACISLIWVYFIDSYWVCWFLFGELRLTVGFTLFYWCINNYLFLYVCIVDDVTINDLMWFYFGVWLCWYNGWFDCYNLVWASLFDCFVVFVGLWVYCFCFCCLFDLCMFIVLIV